MSFAIALSDEQWELVADLFDPPGRRGAPAVIAGVRWSTRCCSSTARPTGCTYLPASSHPSAMTGGPVLPRGGARAILG
jgi:hypothetical protein